MRIKYLVAAAFVAAAAGIACAAGPSSREVFDNGLTAVVREDHAHPVAAVRVYVKVGSVYEGPYLGAGVSHYIEHLLGDGTEKHTKAELEAEVDAMGGAYNAYTWKDVVCYYITVRADQVNRAVAYMEDATFHAALTPESVANQRDIILNEIRMGRTSRRGCCRTRSFTPCSGSTPPATPSSVTKSCSLR